MVRREHDSLFQIAQTVQVRSGSVLPCPGALGMKASNTEFLVRRLIVEQAPHNESDDPALIEAVQHDS